MSYINGNLQQPSQTKGTLDLFKGVGSWGPRGRVGQCARQGLNRLSKLAY